MIVFRRNPNTPSLLINKLPTMENKATSVAVEKNLKALYRAREAVIQSESSDRIKRASMFHTGFTLQSTYIIPHLLCF